jgi:FKBP12-rapamycin complex-associated protein
MMDVFEDLPPRSIVPIVDQLLAQFEHPNKRIRKRVKSIVEKFTENHIQAVAFPLVFMVREARQSGRDSPHLFDFEKLVRNNHSQFWAEIEKITDGLIDVGFTKKEQAKQIIDRGYHSYDKTGDPGALITHLGRLFEFDPSPLNEVTRNNKSLMVEFRRAVEERDEKSVIERKFRSFLSGFCKEVESGLANRHSLDVFAIAPSLRTCVPNVVAMPGFYDVDRPYPRIASFVPTAKLIPSLQRPRKIQIKSDTGVTYRYLLKGGEDLRISQRIMQWFSLASAILGEDKTGVGERLHIEGFPIIPLSPQAGLIVWAQGGRTLYKLIQFARDPIGVVSSPREYRFENAESRTSLQKLELFQQLAAETPDHWLREAIWLLSESTVTWFTQKTNFGRTSAVMSVVGYLIGLGDRHSCNILFMKSSGSAVHIDFSDCFDKARRRRTVPERVPFRLTRMMIKAFGISGYEGVFRMTANFVMQLMRRNQGALLAFLDIVAQDIKKSCSQEDYEKVKKKLNGREFDGNDEMPAEQQVDLLIQDATSDWNLCRMYIGWKPLW